MNIERVVMVEPRAPGAHIYSRYHLPRLGLPILGAIARGRGLDVRVFLEEMKPVDRAGLAGADLVCISTITSTAPAAYALARRARALGKTVVLGGPHATYLPEEGLQHADLVLRGEAERSFSRLLDELGRVQPDLASVPGLSFAERGEARHNPTPPSDIPMDEVPVPDFSLLQGRRPGWFQRGVIPIQTSRGCPHHCKFCSVTPMFGHKMRFMSPERVTEELERHRGQGDFVFFYDDNFAASTTRAKLLLEHLLRKRAFLPRWSAQVSVRAARDPELLELMRRTNCLTVYVGFESINPRSLDALHKRQAVEDIRHTVRSFHAHDMWVHGMFVLGTDADDVGTIRQTAAFILEEDIETVQLLIMTPLPGTELFAELEAEGRLLTRDWSLYDCHHAVFRPRRLSAYQLMDEAFTAMARVYATPRGLGFLGRGALRRGAISLYARNQVRRWRVQNRTLMRQARQAPEGHPYPLPVIDQPVSRTS
jgi:radical SAM superfamily enzyme YgiQ (UPF0313 family)